MTPEPDAIRKALEQQLAWNEGRSDMGMAVWETEAALEALAVLEGQLKTAQRTVTNLEQAFGAAREDLAKAEGLLAEARVAFGHAKAGEQEAQRQRDEQAAELEGRLTEKDAEIAHLREGVDTHRASMFAQTERAQIAEERLAEATEALRESRSFMEDLAEEDGGFAAMVETIDAFFAREALRAEPAKGGQA